MKSSRGTKVSQSLRISFILIYLLSICLFSCEKPVTTVKEPELQFKVKLGDKRQKIIELLGDPSETQKFVTEDQRFLGLRDYYSEIGVDINYDQNEVAETLIFIKEGFRRGKIKNPILSPLLKDLSLGSKLYEFEEKLGPINSAYPDGILGSGEGAYIWDFSGWSFTVCFNEKDLKWIQVNRRG